jgi:hypothetical protein
MYGLGAKIHATENILLTTDIHNTHKNYKNCNSHTKMSIGILIFEWLIRFCPAGPYEACLVYQDDMIITG